jgi:hypothetical protein
MVFSPAYLSKAKPTLKKQVKMSRKKNSKTSKWSHLSIGRIEMMPKEYGDYTKPNKPFLPRYPFKDLEKSCLQNVKVGSLTNDKSIERHRLLFPDELGIIYQAVKSYEILHIKSFLIQHCNVQKPKNLSWPDIIAHLELFLRKKGILQLTKKQKETKNKRTTTLLAFMENLCELEQNVYLKSKRDLLLKLHKNKRITMPKPVKKKKRGQSYLFYEDELKKYWPSYCIEIPTLPKLKK